MGIAGTPGFPGGPGMKVRLIHGYCMNHVIQIVTQIDTLL